MGLPYLPISWGGARGVNVDIYTWSVWVWESDDFSGGFGPRRSQLTLSLVKSGWMRPDGHLLSDRRSVATN